MEEMNKEKAEQILEEVEQLYNNLEEFDSSIKKLVEQLGGKFPKITLFLLTIHEMMRMLPTKNNIDILISGNLKTVKFINEYNNNAYEKKVILLDLLNDIIVKSTKKE